MLTLGAHHIVMTNYTKNTGRARAVNNGLGRGVGDRKYTFNLEYHSG